MRRRISNPLIAGLFAIFMLFMNVFPLVAFANPAPIEVPKLEAPKLEAPNMETPNLEPPKWETPNLEPPKWETPNLQPPETQIPDLKAPNGTVPNLEAPTSEKVNLQAPDSEPPKLQAPQATPVNNGPSMLDVVKGTNAILGQTVVFAEKLSAPDFDTSTVGKELSNMKGRQLLELYKLGTKGHGLLEFSADFGDAGLKIYDAFDARRNFENVRNLLPEGYTRFGQGGSGWKSFFSKSGTVDLGIPKVNPYLGVAGLGLSIYELDQNINAYQNAKNDEQKTEAFVNSVGAVGDSMINVGMIVSRVPIPAVQAAAGVLIIAGTVLSVGSMVLKWASKTKAGQKFVKGAMNMIEGGIKSVKSLFGF